MPDSTAPIRLLVTSAHPMIRTQQVSRVVTSEHSVTVSPATPVRRMVPLHR